MLTKPPQATIACLVRSREKATVAMRAISAAGATAEMVTWDQLVFSNDGSAYWAALLYEIQPPDHRAPELVSSFRQLHPGIPVILYTPMTPAAGWTLEQLVGRHGIHIHLECGCRGEVEALHNDVIRVLNHAPANRLRVIIADALAHMPERLKQYMDQSLSVLCTENGPLQVSTTTIAREMGLTVRTLERTSARNDYPGPKELLSWVTLLYLTMLASQNNVSPNKVGRRLGMSGCTTNRLRKRLLSAEDAEAWKDDHEKGHFKVELVLKAFFTKCGAPPEAIHHSISALGAPRLSEAGVVRQVAATTAVFQ